MLISEKYPSGSKYLRAEDLQVRSAFGSTALMKMS